MRLTLRRVLGLALVAVIAVAAYIAVRDIRRGYWHSHLRQYLEVYARHCA